MSNQCTCLQSGVSNTNSVYILYALLEFPALLLNEDSVKTSYITCLALNLATLQMDIMSNVLDLNIIFSVYVNSLADLSYMYMCEGTKAIIQQYVNLINSIYLIPQIILSNMFSIFTLVYMYYQYEFYV